MARNGGNAGFSSIAVGIVLLVAFVVMLYVLT